MIYIAALLVVAMLALHLTAPRRYAVHASRAKPLPADVRAESRWTGTPFIVDEGGSRLDPSGRFIGRAVRDSMTPFGIPSGATFFADYLTEEQKAQLEIGDFVVIDGKADRSESGFRLRRVATVTDDGGLTFMPDAAGNPFDPRAASEVLAKVTHVIVADMTPGATMRWVRRRFGRQKEASTAAEGLVGTAS